MRCSLPHCRIPAKVKAKPISDDCIRSLINANLQREDNFVKAIKKLQVQGVVLNPKTAGGTGEGWGWVRGGVNLTPSMVFQKMYLLKRG